MFWRSVLLGLLLTVSIVEVMSLKDCVMDRKDGFYYSRNASESYGEVLGEFESVNEDECKRNCCAFERPTRCNFMMYTTLLKDIQGTSSKVTCFLFHCNETSRCITKAVPGNITGASVIGILKRENFTGTDLGNNSTTNSSNIEQHKIYKPSSISTIRMSSGRLLTSINNTILSTNNTILSTNNSILSINNTILSTNNNILSTNNTILSTNNTILSTNNTTLSTKTASLNSNHTNLNTSNIFQPKNTSLTATSIPSNPMMSTHNTSRSPLSVITPSQPIHTTENPKRLNHSFSFIVSSLKSIHNTNHPMLSTITHLRPTLRTHTPRIWPLASFLQHNGSYSGLSTPPSSLEESISNFLNSSLSSPPTFINLHHTSKSGQLSTMPNLHADSSSNVSSLLSNHQASKSQPLPTSQTSQRKGNFSERKSHTTPASLVISLIIGICFFGAVVFLIGRRWGEHCFRRGYSRVDYLLNDYD